MANSTYPGNSALAPEIQQRVQGTFRQTLDLAGKGSLKEALLGCDFVLRLDPDFHPARKLAERLAAASGPVEVSEFQERPPAPPAQGPAAGWNDDDLELPELPLLEDLATDPADLRGRLESLVAERRFDEAVRAAEGEADLVQADPELRRLVEQAQARLEAEPYARPLLDAARRAATAGTAEEAEKLLRKVRALDPTHPEIFEIQRLLAPGSAAGPSAAAAPSGTTAPSGTAAPSGATAPSGAAPPWADLAGSASGADGFSLGPLDEEEPAEGFAPAEAGSGDARIDQLLAEGQAAFERGEHQNAIDAWSRIFLIDIDHRDAARRIEKARRLKAERERETEELFHESVARYDAGERDAAREGFERVLAIAPGYYSAREYLDRMEQEANLPTPPPVSTPRPVVAAEPAVHGKGESKQEILVPPEPGEEERRAPRVGTRVAATARRGSSGSRLFVLVGGGVLLAVLAGAWYLWSSRERLFPNSRPTPTPAVAAVDPIAKARALHTQGKTALAIAQLRQLPPDSPALSEAKALISQWEALVEPKKDGEGPSAEQLARRAELLAAGKTALVEGENIRAVLAFDQAAAIAALEPELAGLAGEARTRVQPLAAELEAYRRGEWEYLLNNLWRKREADPRNRDVVRLMVDSYYNLGVRDLQRGDARAAGEKFREAANIDAHDADLQRLVLFARTYEERSEDLLFRIFVKYLPAR